MSASETLGDPKNKRATDGPQPPFRAAALDRAASVEQLDQLVIVTKPADWIIALVLCLCLAAAMAWGVLGRVPTRVSGEGIFISKGGRVVDAVSAAAGRLQSVAVDVGDHVTEGQPIAEIAQTDIEQKYKAALEIVREREREHTTLSSKVVTEIAIKSENFAKLELALQQVIKAASRRVDYLAVDVKNLEGLLAKGYTTRRNVEERRQELTDAQQRRDDAQNEILKLRSQKTDLETQRDRDLQQSEFALNDARRQMNAAAEQLSQNTQVLSPLEGRVLEVKVSPGSVLAVGTQVIAIESEGQKLEAIVYVAAEHGKQIKPGMQVHLEPSTIKREEFGMMLGTVVRVSEFPMTPQGMSAVLHNESLVNRFSNKGAPYAAEVVLEEDAGSPTGYRWAVGKGPNSHLTSGTLARAEITTRQQRPVDLVIPFIKHLTRIDG